MEENNNNGFEINSNMNQTSTTTSKQKKSKVVPVLVFIIIMLIVLLVLCVGNIYALTKDYDNVFAMVASMVSGKEVVNEEENANLDQPIKDEEDEIVNKEEFSEETIKKTLQNYLDLAGANGVSTGLVLQKLQLIDDYKKLTEVTEDYYVKTNVLHSTYKETMLNYVSEECFNKKFSSELLHKEINGILYYFDGGASSDWISSEVISLKALENGYYLAEYYDNSYAGGKKLETIEFNVNNYNGKCVFNEERASETTKLSEEKVKEVLQNYLNLTTAPNASIVMLEKLNLVDEIEYITDETIPEDHMKINIEYSAYKEKMLNYVTESWLDERFGKAYYEKDGLLCCFFDPGSTGEKEVKSVTLKEGSTYSAEIYVTELSASIDEQIPISETIEFTIENSNGKCIISHCKY